MAMSSFLMNSSPYVEPKFPPSEEYSQNNYIPSQHGEDYYQRQAHGYPYMGESRHRYSQENFSPPAHGGYQGGTGRHNPTGLSQGVTPVDSHGIPTTGGQPYPSPVHPHSDSPNSVPSPSPAPNTPVNGITQCSQGNSGPTVIYPWMKRVHCGQGKLLQLLLFRIRACKLPVKMKYLCTKYQRSLKASIKTPVSGLRVRVSSAGDLWSH